MEFDTKVGIAMSASLHLLLISFLFLNGGQKDSTTVVTSVEMVSLLNPQKSQRQRIKGVKNPKPEKDPVRKKTNPVSQQPADEKLGNDKEDAPEVRGGTTDPQLLAVATYAQELQNYIEKNRYYPRRAMVMEQTGTVKVRLKINARGEFTSVEVIEPSPHDLLNRAAYDLISGLGKFKPLPSTYRGNGEFIVPINYHLGRGI